MALPTKTITWDNLNSSTMAEFDKNYRDGVGKSNLLLRKLLEKKKGVTGGESYSTPIMYALGNGGSYKGMQVLTPTDKEIITTAKFEPAHYEVDITIAKTDMIANQGSSKVFDLLQAKYDNAKMTMDNKLTVPLFGDGTIATYGTAPIVGIAAAIDVDPTSDPTPGAYGGITRDTTAATDYWKNQYKDMTSLATLTMLKLQQLWGTCSDGIIHPDIIVTTQAIFDKCWALADARQQLGNEAAAKLGYTSIDFNGVPLLVDKNCTAGYLYMINTDFLYFKVDTSDDMAAGPFLMGTQQLAQTKYITWTGQLVCDNPRFQGVGFNLT
jgi:hypothetical protein